MIESIRVEWKPQDLWIGMFWRTGLRVSGSRMVQRRLDLWLCVVPCLPIHLVAWSKDFPNPNIPSDYSFGFMAEDDGSPSRTSAK